MNRKQLVDYFVKSIFDEYPLEDEQWWTIDKKGIYTHGNVKGKFRVKPPSISNPDFNYKMFDFMNKWELHKSACWYPSGVALKDYSCEKIKINIDGKLNSKIPRNLQWFFDDITEI